MSGSAHGTGLSKEIISTFLPSRWGLIVQWAKVRTNYSTDYLKENSLFAGWLSLRTEANCELSFRVPSHHSARWISSWAVAPNNPRIPAVCCRSKWQNGEMELAKSRRWQCPGKLQWHMEFTRTDMVWGHDLVPTSFTAPCWWQNLGCIILVTSFIRCRLWGLNKMMNVDHLVRNGVIVFKIWEKPLLRLLTWKYLFYSHIIGEETK